MCFITVKGVSKGYSDMRKKRFSAKDKKLGDWLKKGGREGSKQDFLALIERAGQPLRS